MKRILISLLLTSAAHAAPTPTTKAAQAHVTSAKQTLASARAELKQAKAHERAERRAKAKARTVARAKARLAKLQGTIAHVATVQTDDVTIGCGTCTDNHDGSCTCPPADREDQCRALARKGESWEDACDRVYGVETDPAGY